MSLGEDCRVARVDLMQSLLIVVFVPGDCITRTLIRGRWPCATFCQQIPPFGENKPTSLCQKVPLKRKKSVQFRQIEYFYLRWEKFFIQVVLYFPSLDATTRRDFTDESELVPISEIGREMRTLTR